MDIQNTQSVTIDIRTQTGIPTVNFVQQDKNTLAMTILDKGVPADLTNAEQILVNLKRPDGVIYTHVLQAESNIIKYTLGSDDMIEDGICEVELKIYETITGGRISTRKFKINILKEIGSTVITETLPEVTVLRELLNSIESANLTPVSQNFIATVNQQVFNLTNSYAIGKGQTRVEVDGIPQTLGEGYTETSATSITLTEGVTLGSKVMVKLFETDASTDARFNAVDTEFRLTENKIKGFINISEYGTLYGNGATSDQTIIASAVADAKVHGYSLHWGWDGKTYLTTTNIPDFHNIQHVGNAYIKRGTDVFAITPTINDTNIIYTGFGGVSTNDGLTSAQPMKLSTVRDLLKNLGGKASNGRWRVQFVAGTATDTGLVFSDLPYFSKPLQVWGVWDGTNRLAVWDGISSTAVYAFRADGTNNVLNVEFKDLKFINWAADPSNAGAIVAWYGVNVRTDNVEIKDSTVGVWCRGGWSRHYSDVMDNCVWGYSFQYSHSASIGSSIYTRNIIKNCDVGVFIGRNSVAHADYTDFSGNIVNVQSHQKSRTASVNSTFATWGDVSHWLQGDSLFEDDGSTWDPASITDATPIFRYDTGSAVPAVHIGPTPYRVAHYVPNSGYTVTGGTVDALVSAQTGFGSPLRIPKHLLYNNASVQINVKMRVDVGGTAGTKTIKLAGANSTTQVIAQLDIPAGGSGLGEATFEITFRANGTALCKSQYVSSNATVNALAYTTIGSGVITLIRDKTTDLTLWRLYGTVANAADSMTFYSLTTNLIG
jgi:hypothetical protein